MKKTLFGVLATIVFVTFIASCTEDNPYEDLSDGDITASIGGFDENGATQSTFSIGAGRKVHFSRGNLQYQASTNTWRFASEQYYCVGNENNNASATYAGWIDLFGFGCSGWNCGFQCFQPYSTSDNSQHYINKELTGDYRDADWAWHNMVTNGGERRNLWRTMSIDEWEYLMVHRQNAFSKKGLATIDGKFKGMVLLPDEWVQPSGLTFTPGVNGFTNNNYSIDEWHTMENSGAVFLPAAGGRTNVSTIQVGSTGRYWTTSLDGENGVSRTFNSTSDGTFRGAGRFAGFSVRPVKD